MKLNVKAFGVACGLIWAFVVLIFGIWATLYAPAMAVVDFLGDFYIGYNAGVLGALIGFVWGFLDAGIGGLILAWLYNLLSAKFKVA